MYIPLPLRLTLFFTLLLGLALWFFGMTVYTQAEQRAYQDLDNTLSSRAASVQLGKSLMCSGNLDPSTLPLALSSVDSLGAGGVAIEVLDQNMRLLATTSYETPNDPFKANISGLGTSPVPWDVQAAHYIIQNPYGRNFQTNGIYSTITYQGQHVRVYTTSNTSCDLHIIQAARSEQDIEQSLSDLRSLLFRGAALVLGFGFVGGWLMSWGVLAAVRRITSTARSISASRDFSKRVPSSFLAGRDELATLVTTFNEMLANLEQAYKRQQRFVADASHELRAPITSIRCNLDLLVKAPDLPQEEVQAALNDARAEADRMGRLVSDLLTLARSDETQAQPSEQEQHEVNGYLQEVDLDSLLLEVFRQYRPAEEDEKSEQKRLGPRLMLQQIAPVKVYGDADQLKQVLVALLDNAFKYTPYEGSVTLSLATQGHQAMVKVSDSGIGIAPEDLPHIFERFYRADRARSRDRGGSGLGLAIARSIIQEHQGSIEVESTPGKGSTFTLVLPVANEAGAGSARINEA